MSVCVCGQTTSANTAQNTFLSTFSYARHQKDETALQSYSKD